MKKVIITTWIILGLTAWNSAQNGLDFDGIDDFVQSEYAGVLGAENRTFEAWVYVPSSAPLTNLAILDYGVNIAGSRNTFQVGGNRELRFISGGTSANIFTPDNVIPINQWTHVAFVLDNGTGYLYVDGIQMGTGPLLLVDTPSDAETVTIGERVAGGSIPFHGILDEIRIWDVARTAADIQATMNTEFCSPLQNLKLYLQFNEGIAGGSNAGVISAMDHSGNGYNGVLSNFSLAGATSNWVNGAALSDGSTTSSLQQIACDSFLWSENDSVYTTTGVYTVVLPGANAQGCDSMITLALTINSVNTSVTQDGAVLTANEIGATYQWVECPGMTPISGATSQSYTATTSGDYAVIVTKNLCSDTSACFSVSIVGTIENEFGHALQLFPNPTNGDFSIDMGKNYRSTSVAIMDLNGNPILSNTYSNQQVLNVILNEPAGVYILLIEAKNKKAVIGLVKQ